MNILFVLYGDFHSNSANPLALYTRELQSRGHQCAVAVPANVESVSEHESRTFIPVLYSDVLVSPESVFPDGRPADVIHACTPREIVRHFVTSYMAKRPTPLVIYLEDNESWISKHELNFDEPTLVRYSEKAIAEKLPVTLSHPFRYNSFIGLADAVAVIQDKLKIEVPPWVRCEIVMIGVDLDFFSPRPPDTSFIKKYGIVDGERIIVYHGGVDQFKSAAIESLCQAVALINQSGIPCRLLRTGIRPLSFLSQWSHEAASRISDLGILPRRDLPNLLSLADVFVQPGKIDPFEDLRLPGKVPEFLAMGRPVVMPDANISYLFENGINAVFLRDGTAEEIASKCKDLFADTVRANQIGRAGRLLAEKYFDVRSQARLFEDVYKTACSDFNSAIASAVWQSADGDLRIALVLARKLRLLANLLGVECRLNTANLLRQYADNVEWTERRVIGLEESVNERDSQIATLHRATAQRDEQIGALNCEMAAVLSSRSWRITRPLRFVARLARRVRDSLNRPA
jgi:glycosyltransferase involved in cell wall biosynthesis